MNEKKHSIKSDFSMLAILIIPIAVAVNFVGGQLASLLKLPMYLDTIGTIFAGMLCGDNTFTCPSAPPPEWPCAGSVINSARIFRRAAPATPLWTRWPLLSLRVLKGWYFFPIYPAASIRMPARRQEPYFLEPPWPTPVPILPGPYWNPPPLYSLIFWKCWRRWAVPAGNCALWAAARPAGYGSKSRQMYAAGSWLFPPAGRPPLRALPYWRGAAAG